MVCYSVPESLNLAKLCMCLTVGISMNRPTVINGTRQLNKCKLECNLNKAGTSVGYYYCEYSIPSLCPLFLKDFKKSLL